MRWYKEFREEAERKKFRHFLEVFDPNVPSGIPPEKLGEFINDNILRTLAGVPEAGRPDFLKIVYHGPKAMEELAQYDPNLIVGILGGGAGTTYDAFKLIHDAQKYGARVALFGRKINHAEHQLAFIEMLRLITQGRISPEEAVRAYHGVLQASGIKPHRSLDDDLKITEPGMSYDGSATRRAAVEIRNNPLAKRNSAAAWPKRGDGSPDFEKMDSDATPRLRPRPARVGSFSGQPPTKQTVRQVYHATRTSRPNPMTWRRSYRLRPLNRSGWEIGRKFEAKLTLFSASACRLIFVAHLNDSVNQSHIVSGGRLKVFNLVSGQNLSAKFRQVELIVPHIVEQIVKGRRQVKCLLQLAGLGQLSDFQKREIRHFAQLFPLSVGEVHISFPNQSQPTQRSRGCKDLLALP